MRAEADSNRGPSANQPKALPLGQTGSRRKQGHDASGGGGGGWQASDAEIRGWVKLAGWGVGVGGGGGGGNWGRVEREKVSQNDTYRRHLF